jgi:phosphopantetheine adenylyltransferase
MIEIQVPPGFTQDEFEKLLEDYISQSVIQAIVSYLKSVADIMDENGLEYMTSTDIRRIALEITTQVYQPQ